MRRTFLHSLIAFGLLIPGAASLFSQARLVDCGAKNMSCINVGTTPMPFQELKNKTTRWDHDSPAISTGYYFVTNEAQVIDPDNFWKPKATDFTDTTTQAQNWKDVITGPRQVDPDYWDDTDENLEGYAFFRNPASNGGDFFEHGEFITIDSTDDAIAGPIPLKLNGGFRFNGIRYDSFYVSTNGIVSLSNRRYTYENGVRAVDDKTNDAYDRESMDWYETFRPRSNEGNGGGVTDGYADDYGYTYAACGGNPLNATGGIRGKGGAGRLATLAYKTPVIAPMWGDMELSQFSSALEAVDPHGLVRYMRDDNGEKVYIYFINLQPVNGKATRCGNFTAQYGLRQNYDARYLSANVQVILDNGDNSVTIVYRALTGNVELNCTAFMPEITRYNNVCGVRGFARHQNFRRTDSESTTRPEYPQYTIMYDNERVPARPYPATNLAIKFRQWQNTLRVVDIQYRVRDPKLDPILHDLSFKKKVKSTQVANYELLAGEERLGAIQPVALIQNLTNNIQGPGITTRSKDGKKDHFLMNYVEQDLEFRANFVIVNKASGKIAYNKIISVDSTCMALAQDELVDCADDPDVKIRMSEVEEDGGDYDAVHWENPVDDPTNAVPHFPGDGSTHHEYVVGSGNTVDGRPFNGVPPYGMVQVYFPPWEPSEFSQKSLGRMEAFIIALPETVSGDDLKGEWPFDDTTSTPLFVMKRLKDFYDDATDFYNIDGSIMPSVLKWVNIDAQVVDGDLISKHALPPRGRWSAQYVESPINLRWPEDKINIAKNTIRNSPVIKMNRLRIGGAEPAMSQSTGEQYASGGDEIRSFPIDMRGKKNAILTLSVQRHEYTENWDRGWADQRLWGPEPRVALNGDPLRPYEPAASVSQKPDELVVEFANNFVEDKLEKLYHVTNIADKQWRMHFRGFDQDPIENMPALTVYGAGGYSIGFLENHPDSVLIPHTPNEPFGLRPNIFDDGIDEEFNKYFIAIPDTFINFPYDLAHNFRFRLRVRAQRDQKPGIPRVPDDSDDFYVDNVRIIFEDVEATDIEVSSVKVVWPFNEVPASQATEIPVYVKLTNNTTTDAQNYTVHTNIYRKGTDPETQSLYCRKSNIPTHNKGVQIEKKMPSFNARQNGGPGEYTIMSWVALEGFADKDPRNDTTYTDFTIEFGPEYALDPVSGDPSNDVPQMMNNAFPNKGLNFFGYTYGGAFNNTWDYYRLTSGEIGGSGSGQVAMKFNVVNADTIFGFKAYFASLNSAPDFIEFAIYDGTEDYPSDKLVDGTKLSANRGVDHIRKDNQGDPLRVYNEYTDYRLKKGIVLTPGVYWMTLSQDGETGLELGATKYNQGMRTINVHRRIPEPIGISGNSLYLNKKYRKKAPNGVDWYNENFFAAENSKGSRNWFPFSPTQGNPAYAHLHHLGIPAATYGDGYTQTMSRGTWLPLMRPFFGNKSYNQNAVEKRCPPVPIKLIDFDGTMTSTGAQLFWATASEENNRGFIVERMVKGDESADRWKQIEFVAGVGNSTVRKDYETVDNSVKNGQTYIYRLKQQDIDGTINCNDDDLVILTAGNGNDVVLNQSQPNPFNESSKITFSIQDAGNVTLEVVDVYGNVVRTLVNTMLDQGTHSYTWDGNSATGMPSASGRYIYKLTVGETVLTQNVTLAR